MICKQCQTENDCDRTECVKCGASLIEEAEEKNRMNRVQTPKWLIPIVTVLVLAAMVIGFWMTSQKTVQKKQQEKETAIVSVYPAGSYQVFSTGDGYAVVQNGTVLLKSDSGIRTFPNLDGSAAACETAEGLFLANEQGAVQITDDEQERYDIRVANDGCAAAYRVDDVLYHYDRETEQTVKISNGVNWYALSPTGKYVAYLTDEAIFRWNGNVEMLALNSCNYEINMSVSDNGLIYVFAGCENAEEDAAGALYCFTEEGKRVMIKDGWEGCQPLYNKAQNQVLFTAAADDGRYSLYFSENGQEAVELLTDSNPGIGANLAYRTNYYQLAHRHGCNVDDFRGQIIQAFNHNRKGEVGLFYLTQDLNAKLVLGYSMYTSSMFYDRAYDNSFLYANYKTEDENYALYRADVATGKVEKLAEDVFWAVAAGGGTVYYSDALHNLYRLAEGESVFIAENIDINHYLGVDDGSVLYLDEEETLWLATKEAEPVELDRGVTHLWRDGSGFYYRRGEEIEMQELFYSKDGLRFSQIEGIYYKPTEELPEE